MRDEISNATQSKSNKIAGVGDELKATGQRYWYIPYNYTMHNSKSSLQTPNCDSDAVRLPDSQPSHFHQPSLLLLFYSFLARDAVSIQRLEDMFGAMAMTKLPNGMAIVKRRRRTERHEREA